MVYLSSVTRQTGSHLLRGLGEFGPLQRAISVCVLSPLQVLVHHVLDLLRPDPLHLLKRDHHIYIHASAVTTAIHCRPYNEKNDNNNNVNNSHYWLAVSWNKSVRIISIWMFDSILGHHKHAWTFGSIWMNHIHACWIYDSIFKESYARHAWIFDLMLENHKHILEYFIQFLGIITILEYLMWFYGIISMLEDLIWF